MLPAPVSTPVLGGDPANRIDLVFVGDGYTAGELGIYASHVTAQVMDFFQEEPYTAYQDYFNVHQVDVVSNESGVDNDPVPGIQRDTAMDMRFFCNGIERLLCVSVSKANNFAANAPDVDLIAAIANSTKYGGAGYSMNDLATAAGGNSLSTEILLHEFGHALGDLADEYHYGDGATYNGGEVPEPNVSIRTAAEMANLSQKWFRWLGTNDPMFDGLVSTYRGRALPPVRHLSPNEQLADAQLGAPFQSALGRSDGPGDLRIRRPDRRRLLERGDLRWDRDALCDADAAGWTQPRCAVVPRWSRDPRSDGQFTLDLCALGLTPDVHERLGHGRRFDALGARRGRLERRR